MTGTMPVFDIVASHAKVHGPAPAVTDIASGQHWSYAPLDAQIDQAAVWLATQLRPRCTLGRGGARLRRHVPGGQRHRGRDIGALPDKAEQKL